MSRTPFLLLLSLTLSLPASWPARAQSGYVGCLSIQQIPREECDALETLFKVTNSPDWFNHSEWLATNEPCEWFGVSCANTPWPRNVTKIHLVSNNLAGPLPGEINRFTELTELGNLEKLTWLDLSSNGLTGPIPATLTHLGKLFRLNLDDNDLSVALSPSVAAFATGLRSCSFENNPPALCVPDTAPYQTLGVDPICGLSLDASCSLCASATGVPETECGTLETLYLGTNGLG